MKRRNLPLDVHRASRRVALLRAVPQANDSARESGGSAIELSGDVQPVRDPDARVARLIGGHKRVLVVGRRTRELCRALVSAGCRVSVAGDSRSTAPTRRLPAGPFDAIALVRLIEYVDDPVGLLQRTSRLLTSDGCIVAAVPNITHGSVRLHLLAGQPPPASFEPDAPSAWRCYDGASVRRLLERSGFIITETERCSEAFDCDLASFNGTAVPTTFIEQLAADADAMTSAFVVVAHKSPLTNQVQLQLQVRQFALDRGADRESLERVHNTTDELSGRLARLESRHMNLSGELTQLIDARFELERQHLQKARAMFSAHSTAVDDIGRDLKRLQYEQLIVRIRGVVESSVPRGAVVLVVSKGDARLVDLRGRTGWHFLRTRDGVYAGHHPADSAAAIEALDELRAKGARYLLFPRTSLWWLDHYAAFRDNLNKRFRIIAHDERSCVIYALGRTA